MLPPRFSLAFISACGFLLIGGVDQDPFGLLEKRIGTSYSLERFEGGLYYLQRVGYPSEGGGYIGGTVQAIGWTDKEIFVNRFSTSRADPDGWIVIDLRSDKLDGPFADEEFRSRFPNVLLMSPADAWKRLGPGLLTWFWIALVFAEVIFYWLFRWQKSLTNTARLQ